jgi:hypothetical protein
VLSPITKKREIKSASRPLCEFWRIDDQQLEIYPCIASFVVDVIEKGNMNDVLKSLWPTMKKMGKVVKIFEDYGVLILFES